MTVLKYLSKILLGHESLMMSDFVYVVLPVLSITVLMFGMRSIFQDSYTSKMKKQ